MATRTITIDDLDGTEAFRTIRFSFDGRLFEIDLSREHYDSFKHGLTPWMEAGREVSKFSSAKPGGAGGQTKYAAGKENKKIREWGREQGMNVGEGGPIPQSVLVAYQLRHNPPQAA
jgi:hypothetical protein